MDLENLTEQVRLLAIETGKFLRQESLQFDRNKVEEKNAHDYVSYVDKESEKRIVSKLHEILPEAGFIAEEGSGSLTTEKYCWVVDPLDGTTNFIHNNAPFCISIALRNREEILLGVVYEVCRNECFWAWKGSAAYLNGKEIHVTPVNNLDRAFIELGFPYDAEHFRPIITRLIEKLYGRVGGLRLLGSAAVELCYIAAGRFDARFEGLLGPWDIAAGTIILTQAGGKVTDFNGGDSFYSGHEVLASNGKIHDQLLKIIAEIQN